ncbi:MAG TPA: hypothetical protein VFY79_01240 [Dehalococcoidia bacterium]|jgi:hypothetical protein|nr:hypothetical protein [Dehalococcoidia bacterium]
MDDARREQQVLALLGHPGVGPLSADAVARNVATTDDLRPLLDRLVDAGMLSHAADERYTAPQPEHAEGHGQ